MSELTFLDVLKQEEFFANRIVSRIKTEFKRYNKTMYTYNDTEGIWKPESNFDGRIIEELKIELVGVRKLLEADTTLEARDFTRAWNTLVSYGNYSRISAVIKLCKKSLEFEMIEIPNRKNFLDFKNGSYNLKTFQFNSVFNKEDFITQRLDYDFDLMAKHNEFDKFINAISDDEEMEEFLQIAAGYTILAEQNESTMFFLCGDGANGKSTFINILEKTLGQYSTTFDLDRLIGNQGLSSNEYYFTMLKDKLFVSAAESEEFSKSMNEALIKRLTGNDVLPCRTIRESPELIAPYFKLWVHGNYLPYIKGTNNGIWRRFVPIKFNQTFEKKADLGIMERLLKERPAVINWMINGAKKYLQNAKPISQYQVIQAFINDTRRDRDEIGKFLEFVSNHTKIIGNKVSEVRSLYLDYCMQSGDDVKTNFYFNRKMEERGFKRRVLKVNNKSTFCWTQDDIKRVRKVFSDVVENATFQETVQENVQVTPTETIPTNNPGTIP